MILSIHSQMYGGLHFLTEQHFFFNEIWGLFLRSNHRGVNCYNSMLLVYFVHMLNAWFYVELLLPLCPNYPFFGVNLFSSLCILTADCRFCNCRVLLVTGKNWIKCQVFNKIRKPFLSYALLRLLKDWMLNCS